MYFQDLILLFLNIRFVIRVKIYNDEFEEEDIWIMLLFVVCYKFLKLVNLFIGGIELIKCIQYIKQFIDLLLVFL